MKTIITLLALCVSSSLFAGMGITKESLVVHLLNDSRTTEDFQVVHRDPVYELVPMSKLKHFTRNIYNPPIYTTNTMDCDDLTAIFLGEFKRHLYKTGNATAGGYTAGEIFSHERRSGTYHVDPIVVTEIGTYVIVAQHGTIMRLKDYQRLFKTYKIRI